MDRSNVFIVFPSEPAQVGGSVGIARSELRSSRPNWDVQSWKQIDIPGRFIVEGILQKIDEADFVVADITQLNFNVTFEVGYALGRSKRVVPTINKALSPDTKKISSLGIYDTLGYETYENGYQLSQIISGISDTEPLRLPEYDLDRNASIFVLDTLHKTDASVRINSKIATTNIGYRRFDPEEQSRLSTLEAYGGVKKSVAVVVHLLSSRATDHEFNNLRGAFLAGLAYGLEKEPLIFQEGTQEPVPVDYRDFVTVYQDLFDIDLRINDLAPRVTEQLREAEGRQTASVKGFLANIDLGDPAAENEIETLGDYYVATAEFGQALNGAARLAVGRKGSGKSALFFQVRDNLRRRKSNVILDLKPEGHQLTRFKQQVLMLLEKSVQEHAVAAFWEYVLLLETCRKLLESDRQLHIRDHHLTESYQELKKLYTQKMLAEEGDFSERMLRLVDRISERLREQHGGKENIYLSPGETTELVYSHDIPEIRKVLAEYLHNKDGVYVLFDNLDKGWPTRGVDKTDVIILRALLEASRKLERFFSSRDSIFSTTVFIRNDVYEILVDESPDRGKESRVSLDWTDRELMKEFLRKRLVFNGIDEELSFQEAWQEVCVTHVDGRDSAEYVIDRSLMRPRNFLALVNHCKSSAVNLQQDRIRQDEIKKACATFSADICNEIGLEIRDVFPSAEDIPYYFIGVRSPITLAEVRIILQESLLPAEEVNRLVEILLWFGFLGVQTPKSGGTQETYIYDVYYDMKKLKRLAGNLHRNETMLCIHCAFWPFLDIVD